MVEQITNFEELTSKVLDKPDTKLSQQEIAVLNSIGKDKYKDMKQEIIGQKFDLKAIDGSTVKGVSLKDLVENLDSATNISTVDGKQFKIGRGTELGARIQIYLIANPGVSITMTDQAKGEYLGIDGKIGRFTKGALDELQGRILGIKDTETQIESNEDKRFKTWIEAQFDESLKNKRDTRSNYITENGEKKLVYREGINQDAEIVIKDKEVTLSSYDNDCKINLDTGTISLPGDAKGTLITFPTTFNFLRATQGDKINIEESETNNKTLQKMMLIANFLNFITNKFIQPQKGRDSDPFFRRKSGVITAGGFTGGIHFNDGILLDTDVLTEEKMKKIGITRDHVKFFNELYKNHKIEK